MNADLLREKVNKLSSESNSLDNYLEMHSYLSLEETRAEIHAKIFYLTTLQSYHLISVSPTAVPSMYFIDIDLDTLDGCDHVIEDGDLLLLGNEPVWKINCISSYIGIATGLGRDSCYQKGFHVLISENDEDFDYEQIKHVSFITNIMKAVNVSKAITSIRHGESPLVKSILKFDEKAESKCPFCDEYALEEYDCPKNFNEEQMNAVKCIVSRLRCPHKNATKLGWGPPGSGKTDVAIALSYSLLQLRSRLLICVPREEDILRFLKKFKDLFPSFSHNKILVLRNLDSKDRTENCSIFAETSLQSRAQELYCCIYLWRSWLKEMAFLLQLKPYCRDNCDHDGESTCSQSKLVVFCFKTFKEKIGTLSTDIRKCSRALINSLPAVSLPDSVLENLNKLLHNISLFEDCLLHESLIDSSVKRAFEFASDPPITSEHRECDIAALLNATRVTCVKMIENLVNSIPLPQLQDRNEWEKFCIRHSSVIICTPASSSCLQGLKSNSIDILLVDDAAQVRESDLLIPLSVASSHVVLLGDHLHLQSTGKSEVCKDAGYNRSLFERLLHLPFERQTLVKQYMMHPSLTQFPSKHFYGNKIVDAHNVSSCQYNNQFKGLRLPSCAFFDISLVEELANKGNAFVESAAIMFLLRELSAGLTNGEGRLNVGIVCLCTSRVNTLISELGTKHCLWMIGRIGILRSIPGVWQDLIVHLTQQKCVVSLKSNTLAKDMKISEMPDEGSLISAGSRLRNKLMHMGCQLVQPGKEFTWARRPKNTKYILAQLRDQKGAADTCTFQAALGAIESMYKFQFACLDPPQNFEWFFLLDSLKGPYEVQEDIEFGSEEINRRGKDRLECSLEITKVHDVTGSNKYGCQERVFKISSYEKVDLDDTANMSTLVKSGKIMVVHFRLSRNYFYLEPNECYRYDATQPFIHPKSLKPVSHAVMAIGNGKRPMPHNEGTSNTIVRRHVNIQNSEGKRFGVDGIGKVLRRSLRGMYRIDL